MHILQLAVIAALGLQASFAFAETPVIDTVSAKRNGDLWDFTATITHEDKGWDDYVTAWRILDPSGREIGVREMHMPQDRSCTRTRSLSGVLIDGDIDFVEIEVHDSKLGWSEDRYKLRLR